MAAPAVAPGSSHAPNRLTRRQDFQAVLQDGRRARHHILVVASRPNGLAQNRVGYAIGKRVGNAVIRNLVRRRLRVIVRSLPLRAGHDIVVTARPQAALVTFDELRDAFASCAGRAGLLTPENR